MKKLKTFTVGIFASLIALFMSCPRYDIITHYNWKLIDDADAPDFLDLHFDPIGTKYKWPIIVKNEKCVGVVLFVTSNRLILYSFCDNGIIRYKYI